MPYGTWSRKHRILRSGSLLLKSERLFTTPSLIGVSSEPEPVCNIHPPLRPRAMKIRYFLDTDTHYIELADRVSSSSEAVRDNLIVDFDAQGHPVGLTLEHYSQISDSSTIESLLPITPVLLPA